MPAKKRKPLLKKRVPNPTNTIDDYLAVPGPSGMSKQLKSTTSPGFSTEVVINVDPKDVHPGGDKDEDKDEEKEPRPEDEDITAPHMTSGGVVLAWLGFSANDIGCKNFFYEGKSLLL